MYTVVGRIRVVAGHRGAFEARSRGSPSHMEG